MIFPYRAPIEPLFSSRLRSGTGWIGMGSVLAAQNARSTTSVHKISNASEMYSWQKRSKLNARGATTVRKHCQG